MLAKRGTVNIGGEGGEVRNWVQAKNTGELRQKLEVRREDRGK